MKTREYLDTAAKIVSGQRQMDYGESIKTMKTFLNYGVHI